MFEQKTNYMTVLHVSVKYKSTTVNLAKCLYDTRQFINFILYILSNSFLERYNSHYIL